MLIYAGIFGVVILCALLYVGYYFLKVSLFPQVQDYDEAFRFEADKGNIKETYYNDLAKEDVFITSNYGYKLHGTWLPNDSKKTIIISHGYTCSLNCSIKYMDIFYNKGYNVLVYDHRYHGKSGGENCSMGYYEKFDLKSWVDWVINRVGEDGLIGTHGESMGAATVLMHAAIDDRTDFAIADCPFESLYEQFKYRLKEDYNLPAQPVLFFSDLWTKIIVKTNYKHVSPIGVIKDIKQATLFIHGEKDAFIPCDHTRHMYALKEGKKSLYIAPDADHAESFAIDQEKYQQVVVDFLESI